MKIRPIRTVGDLRRALARIERIIDARVNSRDYDELEVLSILVEDFERRHFPIGPLNPVAAIRFKVEQQGLRQSDLAEYMGGRARVSEVFAGKRDLSKQMIRNLCEGLNIPSDVLLGVSSNGGRSKGVDGIKQRLLRLRNKRRRRKGERDYGKEG
jgi:HTH-type transcriptional regulator/antitoxin HigA